METYTKVKCVLRHFVEDNTNYVYVTKNILNIIEDKLIYSSVSSSGHGQDVQINDFTMKSLPQDDGYRIFIEYDPDLDLMYNMISYTLYFRQLTSFEKSVFLLSY